MGKEKEEGAGYNFNYIKNWYLVTVQIGSESTQLNLWIRLLSCHEMKRMPFSLKEKIHKCPFLVCDNQALRRLTVSFVYPGNTLLSFSCRENSSPFTSRPIVEASSCPNLTLYPTWNWILASSLLRICTSWSGPCPVQGQSDATRELL